MPTDRPLPPEPAALSLPSATLEWLGTAAGGSPACAVLTPAIKARLQALAPGQLLLVRVDDPTARLDVPAWCSLTGHTLVASTETAAGILEFLIRKKN